MWRPTLVLIFGLAAIASAGPCTDERCEEATQQQKRSVAEQVPSPGDLRQRIAQSARFWGKRSAAPSDIHGKLAKSIQFWGKRSPEEELLDVPEIEGDDAPELYFRAAKAALPSKLIASSRFWGRRR